MILIFVLSSLHDAPLPEGTSDKSAHGLGYAILGALVLRAIVGGLPARIRWRQAFLAVALTVSYGVTDEWHQSFVSGRSSDIADVMADALGACLAAGACWLWGIIAVRSDV